ncbi:MAG: hypothetical protein C0622_01985 [Desulfuromonas sp.]|nr:MAG: hypothetical protein C0622_01985 [Desulfuromonas sp.]
MTDKSFRIVTCGEIRTGFDQSLVKSNLQQRYKFSTEMLAKVLSGQRVVLKSGIDREQGKRYLGALADAGLMCLLEPMEAAVGVAAPTPQAVRPAPDVPRPRQWPQPSGQKSSRKNIIVIVLLAGVFLAVVALVASQLWRFVENGFENFAMEEGIEYVEPPEHPLPFSRTPRYSGSEMQNLYDLLDSRQYAELTTLLEGVQEEFERGPGPNLDFREIQAFQTFSVPYSVRKELHDEWVEKFPDHYAPYLARAEFYRGLGWKSRGGKWASETSEEQFSGMHHYFDLALIDYTAALERNPRLLVAYDAMIDISRAHNSWQQDELIQQAQALFPASYQLYKGILLAKLPRWGGSYAEMTSYVHQATAYSDQNPDLVMLYGKAYVDKAWYARRKGDYQKAIELYNKALAYGINGSVIGERGEVYEKIGDLDRARDDFRYVLELNPDYSYAYVPLANVYFKQGDYDAALEAIETSQCGMTKYSRDLNCWYGTKIQFLLTEKKMDVAKAYIASANRYEAAAQTKTYPKGQSYNRIAMQHQFKAPPGTKPYGLTWHDGSLYLSSFRGAAGVYQLDPETGSVLNRAAPEIVYDQQYGGLASNGDSLLHIQAYYDRNMHELDAATLESKKKTFLYTSRFHLSDIAIHNDHIYAVGYHLDSDLKDYRLLKFSQDGTLRASFRITPIRGKSMSPGMTSDGRNLWVSLGSALFKLDPDSGDTLDAYSLSSEVNALAWDGRRIWAATTRRDILTITPPL